MWPRSRVIAGGISLLIYALITLLSSLPARSLPRGIPDVIPHCGEYFLLAFFLIQASARPARARSAVAVFFLAAALGLLDELHQRSVPGRVCSALDLAYDMAGTLAGLAVYRLLVLAKRRDK